MEEEKTWGLRWYLPGTDNGVTLTIRLRITDLPGQSIGPNSILSDQRGPTRTQNKISLVPRPTPPPTTSPLPTMNPITHTPNHPPPGSGDRLMHLMEALNATNLEATKACWLCLATSPPIMRD